MKNLTFKENPYYHPEKCGLQMFESIDTAGSYEFDMFVIWKKQDDNTLWWDTDSGCSCPTPFEDAELKAINQETWHGFKEALNNHREINEKDAMAIISNVKFYLQLK